jgi:hypothetical protein
MKKYLLPLIIAGAGAVIFFTMKGKKDEANKEVSEVEDKQPTQTKTKSKIKSKLKDFDVNKAISKVSNLANKFKTKRKSKKAVKQNIKLPPSPLQPQTKAPFKFY